MSDESAVRLGKLRTVDARNAWRHEAHQFTPWLASRIDLLSEALGLELEVEATEVSVGDFNVDIVARETGTGRRVIVENQLAQTDHGHLGQLLTYTSGGEAAFVVWIATRFRDEHRQALDWLNANTHEGVDFFGIELELLQIDDSPLAPHFKLVATPNEWAKGVREGGRSHPTGLGLKYQRLLSDILARYKKVRPHDTSTSRVGTDNWLSFSAGRAGFGFIWSMSAKRRFRVELYIDTGATSKGYFEALHEQQAEIETELGHSISWERLDARRASRMAVYFEVPETPAFEENEELKTWAVEMMVRWTAVLRPRIKALPMLSTSNDAEPGDTNGHGGSDLIA